jgi:hypothetical protein
MWSIVFSIIISIFLIVNLIRVMIYGRGVLKPNFERVDDMFFEKKSISTNWNTTFGKVVYYVFLIGLIALLYHIVRWLFS